MFYLLKFKNYRNPVYKSKKLQEANDIGIDEIHYVDNFTKDAVRAEGTL